MKIKKLRYKNRNFIQLIIYPNSKFHSIGLNGERCVAGCALIISHNSANESGTGKQDQQQYSTKQLSIARTVCKPKMHSIKHQTVSTPNNFPVHFMCTWICDTDWGTDSSAAMSRYNLLHLTMTLKYNINDMTCYTCSNLTNNITFSLIYPYPLKQPIGVSPEVVWHSYQTFLVVFAIETQG